MRKIIRDILYDNRKDLSSFPLRAALRVISWLYCAGALLRNMLYDRKLLKTFTVPCRVISIGNIIAGGTGKTPVTIMTARLLALAGYRVAVVSRGYKRNGSGVLAVSDSTGIQASSADSGDEPYLIAASLPGVPVVVGKERYSAAMEAFNRFDPDIILLDDAFQHRRLSRDADVVTLDANYPFGNGYFLPRGVLRESPRSLSRAQTVIVTRSTSGRQFSEVTQKVLEFNPGVSIFRSRHGARTFRNPTGREEFELSAIKGKKIAALSNIVNFASFYQLLESLGAEIVLKRPMDDHHKYLLEELEQIREDALLSGAELLVMTAKDERNLPVEYSPSVRIQEYVLDIEALLEGEESTYISCVLGRNH
ncbi:MAG: tetraacyldisaccharide 4'-kinase [Candidatus Latescibacterota bacterium]